MIVSGWQRRIERARELADQHRFAAEILGFFIHVAHFQEGLHRQLGAAFLRPSPSATIHSQLRGKELSALSSRFESFLSLVEAHGPQQLGELSRVLQDRGPNFWSELLNGAWIAVYPLDAPGFLAQAFLQPYAELLRSYVLPWPADHTYAICPFCNRKPVAGVLRRMGDGAARSLVCGFCLNEWKFRRMVCPGCGEENDKKLPVFTASEFDHIRVECCDTCKTYIKTIDLTRDGHADPIVDELASAPLNLWTRDRGYAKLQSNLLGM